MLSLHDAPLRLRQLSGTPLRTAPECAIKTVKDTDLIFQPLLTVAYLVV